MKLSERDKKVLAGTALGLLALFGLTRRAKAAPCTEGETKCVEGFIHICQEGKWVPTAQQCVPPPLCTEGETSCIDGIIHVCTNGQWISTDEECTPPPPPPPAEYTCPKCGALFPTNAEMIAHWESAHTVMVSGYINAQGWPDRDVAVEVYSVNFDIANATIPRTDISGVYWQAVPRNAIFSARFPAGYSTISVSASCFDSPRDIRINLTEDVDIGTINLTPIEGCW